MHSKKKGALGQLAIAADLVSQGFEVFTELGDLSKIDLIAVDSEYRMFKIQVKAITSVSGKVEVLATKSGPGYKFKYKSKQVDVFGIYVLDKNIIMYVQAKEVISQRKSLTIRLTKTKNGQVKGIRYFEQYLKFNPIPNV